MTDSIEQKCLAKGVKLTDQRRTIARVISESKKNYGESDHPDVDELYKRVLDIDNKAVREEQIKKLNEIKQARNSKEVNKALQNLKMEKN